MDIWLRYQSSLYHQSMKLLLIKFLHLDWPFNSRSRHFIFYFQLFIKNVIKPAKFYCSCVFFHCCFHVCLMTHIEQVWCFNYYFLTKTRLLTISISRKDLILFITLFKVVTLTNFQSIFVASEHVNNCENEKV